MSCNHAAQDADVVVATVIVAITVANVAMYNHISLHVVACKTTSICYIMLKPRF